MTQTRRLIINVIASNARSLYALVVGLLTGRWALLALGHESYGLFGLVGGLISFVTLFNMIFSSSVVRFYAVAIGKADGRGEEGVIECCRWFNVVLIVHIVVPLLLLSIGYPIGEWMVRKFLTIPPERVECCVWVFRFTCFSCFCGMAGVPFNAMYTAKQYIAELTIYSFVATTAHFFVMWYFVVHSGDWLVPMAAWYFIQVFVPALIIALRALVMFPECRVVFVFMRDIKRVKRLFSFAGWQFLGSLGMMGRDQGVSILINKFLGAVYNATGTISSTISCQTQTFANAVNCAFAPAISTAYGAKEYSLFVSLVNRCSKFSTLLVLILALPLCLEMDFVVTMWLKEPPPMVATLAMCACGVVVLNKSTCGHEVAINASGRIAKMQICLFIWYVGVAFLTVIAFIMGGSVVWTGIASVLMMACISVTRVWVARTLVGISALGWIKTVFLPLSMVSMVSIVLAMPFRFFMSASFVRMFLVCGTAGIVLLVTSWFWLMSKVERQFVVTKMRSRFVR